MEYRTTKYFYWKEIKEMRPLFKVTRTTGVFHWLVPETS